MRKYVNMTGDFLSYQKGKMYFFDTPRNGQNLADRIVQRGFGKLIPDPNLPAEPIAQPELEFTPPAKALGDTTNDPDRALLNEQAKELGIPNYWLMKTTTLESAIAERASEEEE